MIYYFYITPNNIKSIIYGIGLRRPLNGFIILWIYHFLTTNNVKSIYAGASLPAPTIL
jgi:hypothetical protein